MMALSNQLLDSHVTGPEPEVAPAIAPASAPAYVAPVSVPMLPDPASAPSPDGQFRGEGGTSFGSVPQIYVHAPMPGGFDGDAGLYLPPPNDAYNPAAPAPGLLPAKPRPGDASIMPVPTGQRPTKPAIGSAVEPVTVPKAGPIKGTLLGFDLAVVPIWAWLVGAALLGARVLK